MVFSSTFSRPITSKVNLTDKLTIFRLEPGFHGRKADILRLMIVQISAVDLAVQNPYCLSLKKLPFLRWPTHYLLVIASKSVLMTLLTDNKRKMSAHLHPWQQRIYMKRSTENIFETFHRHSNVFSWMWRLNG